MYARHMTARFYLLLLWHRIAAESGHVDRFIHFSDMGADLEHKSKRMRTKALGDKAVMEAFPTATIMRWVLLSLPSCCEFASWHACR